MAFLLVLLVLLGEIGAGHKRSDHGAFVTITPIGELVHQGQIGRAFISAAALTIPAGAKHEVLFQATPQKTVRALG